MPSNLVVSRVQEEYLLDNGSGTNYIHSGLIAMVFRVTYG